MSFASPNAALPSLRLRGRLLVGFGLFYVTFALAYAATIAYAAHSTERHALQHYVSQVLGLDYPLKALWTLPVAWLLFQGPLRQAPWSTRLLAHGALGPLWVTAWFSSYYLLLPALGRQGLAGTGRVWDVYIPFLFYGVQFAGLHALEFAQQGRWQHARAQQLREQAHASALAVLRAQVQPHFLFNALNSINAAIPPEQEATRELIVQLASTFRFALEASRCEYLALGQEVDFLEAYLGLEQARFGSRLHSQLLVPASLRHRPIPPMLLQPLVENAVRYGIEPSITGGSVRVEVRVPETGRGLWVSITNTGLGWPLNRPLSPDQPGVGLRTTHARLLALGSPGLVLERLAAGGLHVSFYLPT